MTTWTGVPATDASFELAEGVLWDDRAGMLRWVDIWAGRVLAGVVVGDRIEIVDEVRIGQTAGAVALAEDDGLLVAGARGLLVIAPDGTVDVGPDLLGSRAEVRLNDGAIDPQGRLLVGTLSLSGRTDEEVLLRISPSGEVETLRTGIGLSNGIAFSPDGGTVYHVDTLARTVASHPYGPGAFDDATPWSTVLDDTHLPAHPDGLVVDQAGTLWIAQWGGASVRRHAPSGALLGVVAVDARQVSCAGFVGPALDRLAVTTAQEGLSELTDLAGALFLADVEATGIPVPRWAGSTISPYWRTPGSDQP